MENKYQPSGCPTRGMSRSEGRFGWLFLAALWSGLAGAASPDDVAWFHARTARDEARACLTLNQNRFVQARLVIINRQGHTCDIEGPVFPSLDDAGKCYVMRVKGKSDCRIDLRLGQGSLEVTDVDRHCEVTWCGEGISIGKRKMARARRPLAKICGEP